MPRRPHLLVVSLLVASVAARPAQAQRADSGTFTPAARSTPATRATPATPRPRPRVAERDRRKLDYVPAARFAEARQRAVRAGSQGAPVHVAADKATSYAIVVRTDTSEVEQHARWDDLVIVQAGRGVVAFGDRAEGRRMLAPGEYRGGRLTGVYTLPLAPGDIVRVPAGVPHAFWPTGGGSLEYTVVKVRRPELPIGPK